MALPGTTSSRGPARLCTRAPGALARGLALAAACVLAVLPAAAPGPARAAEVERIYLTLYPLSGADVLYRGVRSEREEAGRRVVLTEYTRPDGTPVQRSEAIYDPATLAPLSYQQRDARSGEEERLERDGGKVTLTHRAAGADAPKSATVDWTPERHMSATVGPLIRREWARLMAGETVPFRLLVPSRRDVYQFRLYRDNASPLAAGGRIVVRMEPGTWLVRQLVDPLFLVYEAAPPHRLAEFHGRSSIKTDAGADQDLRTVYSDTP
jgi:hypothetical protein